jgi:hypothetical protein
MHSRPHYLICLEAAIRRIEINPGGTRNKEIFGGIERLEMESGKNFDGVQQFKYLGGVVIEDNEINEEIKARTASGNRC